MKNFLLEFVRYRFNLDEDKAEEEEISSSIRKSVEFRGTNLWALIFAIFIASIGLNVNSTAVIIGAMLISPIMGPIVGLGLGLGIFDSALIRLSLKNLLVAVVISLLASTIYFFLTPLHEAQSELLARTRPTIWDVLIALFGGLAGVIASTRRNISNTVPGVAIATALMPPLCTAGYGLATGNLLYFAGAFYLFIINSVFISISTFLIIRFLDFKPVKLPDPRQQTRMRRLIWYVAVLTIVPSLYLAFVFVSEEMFKQKVNRFISTELRTRGLYVLDKNVVPQKQRAELLVHGPPQSDSLFGLLISRKHHYGLTDAELTLKNSSSLALHELKDLRENLKQEMLGRELLIDEKQQRIDMLEKEIRNYRRKQFPPGLYHEFVAIFGPVEGLAVQEVPVWTQGAADTVLLVYVGKEKRLASKTQQISSWLKARLNKDSVRIVTDLR